MPRVVSVANQKGGVGKTTTAANLASCLAVAGRPTLLVDMDPQANATSGLGIDPGLVGGKVHPLLGGVQHRQAAGTSCDLDGWIVTRPDTGPDVLVGTPDLQEVERRIGAATDAHKRLAAVLGDLAGRAEFVVIDCPPSLGLLTANALFASDQVIVPIQCEYFAMEGLSRILDLVARVGRLRGREVAVAGFLLTMFDPEHPICHEVAQEVRRYFKRSVFATVVPRDVTLAEAPSHGLSILEYSPRSRGAHAYMELTREAFLNG